MRNDFNFYPPSQKTIPTSVGVVPPCSVASCGQCSLSEHAQAEKIVGFVPSSEPEAARLGNAPYINNRGLAGLLTNSGKM